MRCAALCVVLAGCDLVFPIDPEGSAVGPRCDGPFRGSLTEVVLTFADRTADEFDPSTSTIGTELWFTTTDTPTKDIVVALRDRGANAFDRVMPGGFSDPGAQDFDPALTADGRRLLFLSDRGGGPVFEVERDRPEAPFGAVKVPAGLDDGYGGIDISADGLTLYYDDGASLHSAHRPTLSAGFEPPVELGFDGKFPAITPDELEIAYVGPDGIRRRRRAAIDAPWSEDESPLEGGAALDGFDPEYTDNGDTLIVARDGGLFVTERVCP